MQVVGQPIRKKDAMALVQGKPVFTDDLAPKDCLVVKVLRSPHANAMVKNIKSRKREVPYASSWTADYEEGCHGAGDRPAGIYR